MKKKKNKKIEIPSGFVLIKEMPNYYINEYGKIFSLNKRGLMKEVISQPCGYIRHTLYDNYKTLAVRVHSLVAQYFIGPRPKGMQVNHIDGNKTNNHYSNLEYVTPLRNVQHSVEMGLKPSWFKSVDNNEFINFYRTKNISWIANYYGIKNTHVARKAASLLSREERKFIQYDKQRKTFERKHANNNRV